MGVRFVSDNNPSNDLVYSQWTCAFLVSTSVVHVKSCLALVINYANLN